MSKLIESLFNTFTSVGILILSWITYCISFLERPEQCTTDWRPRQQEIYFFQSSAMLGAWDQCVSKVDFFWSLSSWLVHGCLLPESSHDLPSVPVSFQNSYKDMSHSSLGFTLMTSFELNYLFKHPISKCSHILRYWRLVLQHRNFGWT